MTHVTKMTVVGQKTYGWRCTCGQTSGRTSARTKTEAKRRAAVHQASHAGDA